MKKENGLLRVKTSDINDFLKRVSKIKQTSLLPILDYIKLEVDGEGKAFLYDTNLQVWCVHEIEVPDAKKGEYLLDRKLLGAMVASTQSDTIFIRQEGTAITLSDSEKKGIILNFKRPEDEHYPEFPSRTDETKKTSSFTPELVSYINVAKEFINSQSENQYSFVHITFREGQTHLVCSDGHIAFYRYFDIEMPGMLMTKDCADIVGSYEQGCSHYSVENYDFFDFGRTTYGFIKTEWKTPDFQQVFNQFSDKQVHTVSKAELLNFVNLALRVSPLTYTLFDIMPDTLEENMLRLEYNLPQYSIMTEKSIPVTKNYDVEKMLYNANQLAIMLRSIKSENVNFYPRGKASYIKDEKDDRSLFMIIGYDDKAKNDVAQKK